MITGIYRDQHATYRAEQALFEVEAPAGGPMLGGGRWNESAKYPEPSRLNGYPSFWSSTVGSP